MTFSELNITIERSNYTDPKVSINDILNVPILILSFKKDVPTSNGLRHLVRISIDNQFRVFFTAASQLVTVLNHDNVKFPFETVIKSYKVGDKRGYEFT